jgi:hypothetical protein
MRREKCRQRKNLPGDRSTCLDEHRCLGILPKGKQEHPMRNTLRVSLLTAGLLAATLPMSAFAADAPTSPRATRVQRHAADEAANATAIALLRHAAARQPALKNAANSAAIAANRKARLARRHAANLANEAARAKHLRSTGSQRVQTLEPRV